MDKVQAILSRLNGQILRFPVPAGAAEGDRSVKESVAAGLAHWIDEHHKAVAQFGEDTREDILQRSADKIRTTRLKVEANVELLADERTRLDRELVAATPPATA